MAKADVQELAALAAKIIYDDQGVEMIKQFMTQHAKDPISGAGMLAGLLCLKFGPKLGELSEEEIFGEQGLVHAIIASIFEVMVKALKINVPPNDPDSLEKAYTVVEEILDGAMSGAQAPQQGQMQPQQQAPQQPEMNMFMPGGR